MMRRNQQEFGVLPAVIDGDMTLNWSELIGLASRFGGYLQAHGIGPGDVVLWQLPNWWESLAVAYGIWAAGAVSSPVVPIYREHELRQVIEAVRPRCVVVPESFRGVDHVALVSDACNAVGHQPDVRVVLRGAATGWTMFDDAVSAAPHIADNVDLDARHWSASPRGRRREPKGWPTARPASSAPGSAPPGRRHTAGRTGSTCPPPWPMPPACSTAVAIPSFTGCSVVLRDRWDAEQAIDDMAKFEVTFSSGAAIFIQELLAALASRGQDRLELSSYPCGGSTIPTSLALAAEGVGMHPARSWGMTECPGVTSSAPFEPKEIRCGTDGRIAPGCEVRVVDFDGNELGPDEIGEFLIRGPQRALGYLDPEHTRDGFDDQGWFRTGDLGFLTAEGVLSMTGRSKEIINRGGEKISGREIEDLLAQHPGITEASVVPAPHPRLGEQPAAFILTRGDVAPSEKELCDFLRAAGSGPPEDPRGVAPRGRAATHGLGQGQEVRPPSRAGRRGPVGGGTTR